MISNPAISSFGESKGCVSEVPFTWVISVSGSLRWRSSAHDLSIGWPFHLVRSYIVPSEPFALCGIDNALDALFALVFHPVPQVFRVL